MRRETYNVKSEGGAGLWGGEREAREWRDERAGLSGLSGYLVIWFVWFVSLVSLVGSENRSVEPKKPDERALCDGEQTYTYSARRWISGREKEISESGTEEERRNSLAGVHPKSGHRGRGRPNLATRPSLIRL